MKISSRKMVVYEASRNISDEEKDRIEEMMQVLECTENCEIATGFATYFLAVTDSTDDVSDLREIVKARIKNLETLLKIWDRR